MSLVSCAASFEEIGESKCEKEPCGYEAMVASIDICGGDVHHISMVKIDPIHPYAVISTTIPARIVEHIGFTPELAPVGLRKSSD
jgi:hypothetical protein